MEQNLIALGVILILLVVVLVKTAVVVPQRSEFVVERLGKYRTTLEAGFHILFPFLDKVAHLQAGRKRGGRCRPATGDPSAELRLPASPARGRRGSLDRE